jgi:hypothetical protein
LDIGFIMQIRWLYILIGNDKTGKTTLQKKVIERLCGFHPARLNTNSVFEVTCLDAPRRLATLFAANRRFQEKKAEYKTVKDYFDNFFKEASVGIISSHITSAQSEIDEMIQEGKRRFYNVVGVFFSNAINNEARQISSELNWDERVYLENPHSDNEEIIQGNISDAANYLADLIIGKYTRK